MNKVPTTRRELLRAAVPIGAIAVGAQSRVPAAAAPVEAASLEIPPQPRFAARDDPMMREETTYASGQPIPCPAPSVTVLELTI